LLLKIRVKKELKGGPCGGSVRMKKKDDRSRRIIWRGRKGDRMKEKSIMTAKKGQRKGEDYCGGLKAGGTGGGTRGRKYSQQANLRVYGHVRYHGKRGSTKGKGGVEQFG